MSRPRFSDRFHPMLGPYLLTNDPKPSYRGSAGIVHPHAMLRLAQRFARRKGALFIVSPKGRVRRVRS